MLTVLITCYGNLKSKPASHKNVWSEIHVDQLSFVQRTNEKIKHREGKHVQYQSNS